MAGLAAGMALMAALPPAASADDDPEITQAPEIRGVAQVGEELEAHGAKWEGRGPFTVTYTRKPVRCART